jgi:hypothetical protein
MQRNANIPKGTPGDPIVNRENGNQSQMTTGLLTPLQQRGGLHDASLQGHTSWRAAPRKMSVSNTKDFLA